MSARPRPDPLPVGDLDLLISRSLDGDLPPEEERDLQRILAADPAARARYDALSALVRRLGATPDPEPPFALATRVNAQVHEGTKGLAAAFHRFGLYPRAGTIALVGAALVVVVVGGTLLNPPDAARFAGESKAPPAAKVASQDDGRVEVFFGDRAKSQPAGAPARTAEADRPASTGGAPSVPEIASAESPARTRANEPTLLAQAKGRRDAAAQEGSFAPEKDALASEKEKKGSVADEAVGGRAAGVEAEGALHAAREEARANGWQSSRDEMARAAPAAPKLAATGAAAPPAAAPGAGASAAPAAPPATVVPLPGDDGVVGWRLAAPARLSGLRGPFEALYRLELGGDGRVVSLRAVLGGTKPPPGLEERLGELVFQPVPGAATSRSVEVRVRIP